MTANAASDSPTATTAAADWHALSTEAALERQNVTVDRGLSASEVQARRATFNRAVGRPRNGAVDCESNRRGRDGCCSPPAMPRCGRRLRIVLIDSRWLSVQVEKSSA